jgi:HD superfamily phosphodiesterase
MGAIVKKVIKYAKEELKDNDKVHGFKHAETTARFAESISREERANTKLCIISAWLHDISLKEKRGWVKETIENNHGIESFEKSKSFLISLGLTSSEVNEICDAMSCHCFPNIQTTLTSKILWDSDKLNIFSKEMKKDYLKYWAIKFGDINKAKEQMKKEKEYYLKYFNTITAKEIASKLVGG